MLKEKFAKNLPSLCTTPEQLNAPVNFFVSGVNTAIDFAIPKTKPSPKSLQGFDEKCKEV